jgi:NADH:ubiquinone oxidoreductase subunit 5 (subunit L)/multisubunit Na+/H+ antiporter MnhA subunit/multisubunit Na+/H+ antiporter MnhB subunit
MPDAFVLLLAIVAAPLAFVPLVLLADKRQRSASAWVALPGPLISLGLLIHAAMLSGWGAAPLTGERPWVSGLDLSLAFRLDGLALFYGLVVAGVGVLVTFYSRYYLDEHAKHHGRFYAFLLLFMSAMLGTVLADDLLILFTFWELTGIASFLLIGFFAGERQASAYGARRALLITLATGLGLLAGALLIKLQLGTTRLSTLLADPGIIGALADPSLVMLLLLLAAFGKSAQFPFHFWLPGAMEAPTPVSAYLHSATMVKLGVFLTGRLYPLFNGVDGWSLSLILVGGLTLLVGAWGAIQRHDFKAVLAYTTLAQLGALLLWYGLAPLAGVPHAEAWALLLVLAHVLYKGGLFMVAGIVDHTAHSRDLQVVRGLGSALPLSFAAVALCAASQAGLPGTLGFIAKEQILEAALKLAHAGRPEGWGLVAVLLVSAALYTVVALRVALKPFTGAVTDKERKHWHVGGWALQAPALLLGLGGLTLGLMPGLAAPALAAMGAAQALDVHAWHGVNQGLLLSLLAWGVGGLVYYRRYARATEPDRRQPLDLGAAFDGSIAGLVHFAKRASYWGRINHPTDYLPVIVTAVTLILGVTVLVVLPLEPLGKSLPPTLLESLVLTLMAGSALVVVMAGRWTTRLISLSTAGFLVCFYFMLHRAPDLALTQMLIEVATLVLLLLLLGRFPQAAQTDELNDQSFTRRKGLAALSSAGLGLLMFSIMLHMTAKPHPAPMGRGFLEQTLPLAMGGNAVNTVLVDFRGWDTMLEITVLVIAALGCLGLLMRPSKNVEEGP